MSVSVWHTRLSREKLQLEVCISGWNRIANPTQRVLPHSLMNKSQEIIVSGGNQKLTSAMKQRPEK